MAYSLVFYFPLIDLSREWSYDHLPCSGPGWAALGRLANPEQL